MKNRKTKIIVLIGLLILFLILLIILLTQKYANKLSRMKLQTAKATVYTKIGDQEINITNLIETNPRPTISAGMIPIKLDGEYWVITTPNDNSWCDYTSGKPAYMMLNDGVYQSEEYYNMPSDKKLAKDNVGTQISVNNTNTLGTIYMWIPKFAYSEEDIVYIKQENVVGGNYTMPECFTYKIGEKEICLSGVWVEINKLESENATSEKVTNLNKGEQDTTYGFMANTKANAMTLDEQNATQIYIQYIANVVGASIARLQINDITTQNHTILKIIDQTKTQPINGIAEYNVETEKIEISVTYNKNDIAKIINSKGETVSENSLTANSGNQILGRGIYIYYIVDKLGNIKQISIELDLNVIIISNLQELKEFRNLVNGGNRCEGVTVYQIADIDLNEGKYSIDTETGEITFDGDAEVWDPIARKGDFRGIYNALGHSISGMYINEGYGGFFYNVTGNSSTKKAVIKNLTIKDSYIKTNVSETGAFVGKTGTNTIIENCINYANLEGAGSLGGICGYGGNATIIDCINYGNITGTSNYIGGIAGKADIIKNCINMGNIYGNDGYLAGIVGNGSGNIENCINYGNIIGSSDCVSGIVASWQTDNETITKCVNKGDIKSDGKNSIAGICGQMYGKENIVECYNVGKITGKQNISGICGFITQGQNGNIENCYNTGEIISTYQYAGGILGYCSSSYIPSINNCYNTGNIQSGAYACGISAAGGDYNYVIQNCYNSGNVTTTTSSGYACGITLDVKVKNCYNNGTISGYSNIYGIGGYNTIRSYNTGNIISQSGNVAGIHYNGNAYDCYNTGNVQGNITSSGYSISGITIYSNYTMCNYNIGQITAHSRSTKGEIVAQSGGNSPYNYYLDTSTVGGLGNRVSEGELKNLVPTLNENTNNSRENNNTWKYDIGINNGYPILSWQTDNDKLNLINEDDVFVEDTNNINNGYPIFKWQVE